MSEGRPETTRSHPSSSSSLSSGRSASARLVAPAPRRRPFVCRDWVFGKLLHCLETRPYAKTCGVLVLGGPGCGKSTICSEIIAPTAKGRQHRLAAAVLAHHACSLHDESTLGLPRFILNLYHQIRRHPGVGPNYCDFLEANPDLQALFSPHKLQHHPDEVFKKGLILPLLSLPPPDSNLCIVVDSIDEALSLTGAMPRMSGSGAGHHGASGVSALGQHHAAAVGAMGGLGFGAGHGGSRNIAEMLATHHQLFPQWLLLACTCRPQSKSVVRLFAGFRKIALDDLRKAHVVRDVQQYILARLDSEERLRRHLNKETAEMLNMLHIKSNACVLYLETVLDGVLDGFVGMRDIADIPGTLNGLYTWLCQRLFARTQFDVVRPILNVMLAAPRPLPLRELFSVVRYHQMGLDWTTFQQRLRLLRRVLLHEPAPGSADPGAGAVRLFHHSFADWLLDVKHCTQNYLCSVAEGHALLALRCTSYALRTEGEAGLAGSAGEEEEAPTPTAGPGAGLGSAEVRRFAHHLVRSGLQPPVKAHHYVLWLLYSGAPLDGVLEETDETLDAAFCLDLTARKLLQAAGATPLACEEEPPLGAAAGVMGAGGPGPGVRRSVGSPDTAGDVQQQQQVAVATAAIGTAMAAAAKATGQQHNTLCTAAYQGNLGVVSLLLSQGADVESRDRNGSTALILASRQGHKAVVELLLKSRARIDYVDKDGWSALRSAAWGGHIDVVDLLLKWNAAPNLTGHDERTALRAAAWGGHAEIIQRLLESGADVDKPDLEGRTPLIAAAYMGSAAIVEQLIDAGAEVNHADQDGRTALCVAALCVPASKRHQEVVQLLLERGAQVDRADREGMTPLLIAAYEGQREVCELLLEWDADVDRADRSGRTPLLAAASCGHAGVVSLLLFWGASIHCLDASEGRSVLSIASSQGNADVVSELLARGLDEMHRDNSGMTPLHLAASDGHVEVCRILLEAGARPSELDNEGRSPLMLASQEGHVRAMALLLDAWPAGVDRCTLDGRTPVRAAALDGRREALLLLLSRGADVNARDADGRTALYMCALEGRADSAEVLLAHGADPFLKDTECRTPLHVACWQGRAEVAALLLRSCAPLNARDAGGRTPLISAAWQGHQQLCRLLVEAGAAVDANCDQGATALSIAAQEGHWQVCSLLLRSGANPLHADAYGRTPHRVALKAGHQLVCRLLEEYGASPSSSLTRGTTGGAGTTGGRSTDGVSVPLTHVSPLEAGHQLSPYASPPPELERHSSLGSIQSEEEEEDGLDDDVDDDDMDDEEDVGVDPGAPGHGRRNGHRVHPQEAGFGPGRMAGAGGHAGTGPGRVVPGRPTFQLIVNHQGDVINLNDVTDSEYEDSVWLAQRAPVPTPRASQSASGPKVPSQQQQQPPHQQQQTGSQPPHLQRHTAASSSGSSKRGSARRIPSIMTNPLFNGYLSNLTKKMQETSLDKRDSLGTKIETPL